MRYFRRFPILMISLFFLPIFCSSQSGSLSLYYIANEGFLIQNGNTNIIIDSLFTNGWNKYHVPSPNTLSNIENANAPFNNRSIMLISHGHQDHFDSNLVVKYLEKNPHTVLFTSENVKEQLIKNTKVMNYIRSPQNYEARVIIDNKHVAEIVLLELPHADDPLKETDNVGFLIKINNITLFFPGDALSNDINVYKNLNLDTYNIGLFFSPKWFISNEYGTGGLEVIKYINPDVIIGMHIEAQKYDYYKSICNTVFNTYQVIFFDTELSRVTITKQNDNIEVTSR